VGEFEPDVQALQAAGIAAIFAAGNSGQSVPSSISPANYPESFAVGAVDETFTIASFSSRGPSACDNTIYPDVVAPGVNIRVADLTFGGFIPDSYVNASGTSFSSPHVAGTMALLLSAFPDISIPELEQVLKISALDLGLTGSDNIYGNGLIDAFAAFLSLGGVATEWVSAPAMLTGSINVAMETAYFFSTGGAISSIGDQVQYFFDWGDGTDSGWLSPDTSSSSKSWTSPGT
jgi:subtilisin family serine protease